MKNSLETRLGMFFAVVVIAVFLIFELVGGGALFRRGQDFKVLFATVKDLKVGDPVRLAGVPVGRVKAVGIREIFQPGTNTDDIVAFVHKALSA